MGKLTVPVVLAVVPVPGSPVAEIEVEYLKDAKGHQIIRTRVPWAKFDCYADCPPGYTSEDIECQILALATLLGLVRQQEQFFKDGRAN